MNIDKTARTAREMAETQRGSFEAIAENFAAAQRRGMGLAEGGLEFVRQQESMRALTQGWVGAYRDVFSPFAYVQQGMRTFQRATQQGLEATEQVARQGLRATEEATRQGLR